MIKVNVVMTDPYPIMKEVSIMRERYISISFLFFLLTALSGFWMRFVPLSSRMVLPYDNVLHAHSHLAILGWAFLGVFIIFLSVFRKVIDSRRQANAICFFCLLYPYSCFLHSCIKGMAYFPL